MIMKHKTNNNLLFFFMSIVYISVISTVVVQTRNGTQRGIRAWVSINYN